MLRKQSTGRVQLRVGGGKSLAEIGKQWGRLVLEDVVPLVKPEIALAWHRKLVAKQCAGSQHRALSKAAITYIGAAVELVTHGVSMYMSWWTLRPRTASRTM
jgi:hypothetical protein